MKKYIYSGIIFLIPVVFLISPFFIKIKISCRDQYGICGSELQSRLSSFNGKNLYSARGGITKILKSDYLVSDFSLQFKLPSVLEVNVVSKKPQFALLGEGGSVGLVDFDGTVLETSSQTSLPEVVTTESVPQPGSKVNDNTLTSLKLLEGVYKMYQVRSGQLAGDSLVVDLPGQIRVIFPLDEDVQILLGSLRLIYPKVTSGDLAGVYSQIDLRFKNPVLR